MELIGSRGKIAVKSLASISGLLPLTVATIEPVAVSNSLRNHITKRRIVDFKIACQRRKTQPIFGSIFFAVSDDSLEIDRRRYLIPDQVTGVNRLK